MNNIPGSEEISSNEFKTRGDDTTKIHLVGDTSRLGVNLFTVRLEHTYFPPRTKKNGLLDIVLTKWPEGVILTSSVPIEYREQVEVLAKTCGLRLADGIPTISSIAGTHQFPISGPTVYTLENIPGHPVYTSSVEEIDKLREEEMAEVKKILDTSINIMHKEFIQKGYSPEQISRIVDEWCKGNEEYDEIPERINHG